MDVNYSTKLLKNVHENLILSEDGETFLVQGEYEYWHYGCDGFNDRVYNYIFTEIIAVLKILSCVML